jgi:WD40 repeat protein
LAHEEGKLITGGKDKKLSVFNTNPEGHAVFEKKFDLEKDHEDDGDDDHHDDAGDDSCKYDYPKALDYQNGKILVGLRDGKIQEIDLATGHKKLLLASHHEGEAWGLEVVPEENIILTVGDDNKIMAFDYENRKLVREGRVNLSEDHGASKVKQTASTLSEYHGKN